MSTSAAPVARADVGQRGIAQAADVVDDARAGGDRRRGDRGLVRVDRHDRAELADEPLDQRHDARDLLSARDRRAARDRRLAADVDEVRAGLRSARGRESTRASRSTYSPASENESGEALTIPMSHGRSPSASVWPAAATANARIYTPIRSLRSSTTSLPALSRALTVSVNLPRG